MCVHWLCLLYAYAYTTGMMNNVGISGYAHIHIAHIPTILSRAVVSSVHLTKEVGDELLK